MSFVQTLAELESIYADAPTLASTAKETGHLTAHYRQLIEASPFLVLATSGPEGLDCSPRGDRGSVVRIADDWTLILPDRRGNNRIDSLRNILRDPRVALLFLIPGSGTTFRVNGRAAISADPVLLQSFEVDGRPPRSAIIVRVDVAYFQCARAIVRSGLWDNPKHADTASLPTPGQILESLTEGTLQGETYDREWPSRAAKSMW
jgi:PPOX class probable FMN-dependent enzyme